jgi:Domain of unknown function (DUF4375)
VDAWSVIEPHWASLNEAWDKTPSTFLARFQRVPRRAGLLYAGNWCVSEVDNGGFLQFFWNTTGILAPEALECLEAVGAEGAAQALADAMRHFGRSYPREREVRLRLLGGDSLEYPKHSPFISEDNAFYNWFSLEKNAWSKVSDLYAMGA